MDPDYEQKLEAAVRRELNTLGELSAPPGLETRILRAIEQRATAPWHRQAWTNWPQPLRFASVMVLLVAFGGLCFGAWYFTHTTAFATAWESVSGALSGFDLFRRTLKLLANSIELAFTSLGPVFIAGIAVMLASAYALCIGLGTIYVRLAFGRRET